ncbi:hypothetical protein [Aestuariivirga sp.]|uniref:hypothetical protein n=1 Tax=Aestuariivirga sp. TaxID=2650926 RepID=UPI00391CAAE5
MLRRAAPLAALLILLGWPAAAQEFDVPEVDYPSLPGNASSAAGFVPEGWVPEKEIRGDLDMDGAEDLVLVLRDRNPANILTPEWSEEERVDTNPRILATALAAGEGYRLVLENHTLIPRVTSFAQSDPLSEAGGVAIDRGGLKVDLYYFSNAGGSDAGFCTYRFRYAGGRFGLIGYDRDNTNRMTGDTTVTSINFLTGKVVTTTGNIESDETQTTTRRLPKRALRGIGELGEGCVLDPE